MFSLNEKIKEKFVLLFFVFIFVFIFLKVEQYFTKQKVIIDHFQEKENYLVVYDEKYEFTGKVESVKQIFLNNQELFLDENHKFQKNIKLYYGLNSFIFYWITENGEKNKKKIYLFYQKR